MNVQELQFLRENRLGGESLTTTKERLEHEMMPVSDAIVPQNHAPVLPAEPLPIDIFDGNELIIPRWKIVQPTSQIEDGEPGHFYNTVTGEQREMLESVILLERKSGRVLFPETDDFSGVRTCWSWDGMIPAQNEILMKTGEKPKSDCCMIREAGKKIPLCSFASWRDENGNPDEKGKHPPLCKESIGFLGHDEEMMPFSIIFHGSAIPQVKSFLSIIYLQWKQGQLTGEKVHIRDFKLNIALKLQKNGKGRFYVPSFQNIRRANGKQSSN